MAMAEDRSTRRGTGDELTGSALTAGLPAAVVARSLSTVGIYLAVAALATDSVWAWLVAWPLLGVVLFGFSAAAHECIHGNFARSRWVNRAAGVFWMTPLLLNYTIHRQIHLQHHARTGREGDPELSAESSGYRGVGRYLSAVLCRATVIKPLYLHNWRTSAHALRARNSPYPTGARRDTLVLLLWVAAMTCATFLAPRALLMGYWIPAMIFAPLVFTLISLPEHYQVARCDDALSNTRTIATNPLVRFLIWNINYHTAHHFNPRVPFHRLPELDALIRTRAPFRMSSYLQFHWRLLRGRQPQQ
jgi:fatty acid desaturase